MIPDEKYGGLLTIMSYLLLVFKVKLLQESFIASIMFLHGDERKFPAASSTDIGSMSSASTNAFLFLCAIMSAMTPQPQPASRILAAGDAGAQAPVSTPSTPTFMELMWWLTENCLKWNWSVFILQNYKEKTICVACHALILCRCISYYVRCLNNNTILFRQFFVRLCLKVKKHHLYISD